MIQYGADIVIDMYGIDNQVTILGWQVFQ